MFELFFESFTMMIDALFGFKEMIRKTYKTRTLIVIIWSQLLLNNLFVNLSLFRFVLLQFAINLDDMIFVCRNNFEIP